MSLFASTGLANWIVLALHDCQREQRVCRGKGSTNNSIREVFEAGRLISRLAVLRVQVESAAAELADCWSKSEQMSMAWIGRSTLCYVA
jgi:hypothetical protein